MNELIPTTEDSSVVASTRSTPHEVGMKHKKVSDQHAMIAKFTEEALRLGGGVSVNQRHFIKAALAHGKTMEPAGRLAGANRACSDV